MGLILVRDYSIWTVKGSDTTHPKADITLSWTFNLSRSLWFLFPCLTLFLWLVSIYKPPRSLSHLFASHSFPSPLSLSFSLFLPLAIFASSLIRPEPSESEKLRHTQVRVISQQNKHRRERKELRFLYLVRIISFGSWILAPNLILL